MRTTVLQDAVALRRAVTQLASRARLERGGRLSLNQVAALGRVATDGPITPGELAEQLQMLPQSLTRTLAALESQGFVRRTPDPEDGRGSLLTLTTDGRSALRLEMGPRDRWIAGAITAVCADEEREILRSAADIMQRLAAFGGDVAPAER